MRKLISLILANTLLFTSLVFAETSPVPQNPTDEIQTEEELATAIMAEIINKCTDEDGRYINQTIPLPMNENENFDCAELVKLHVDEAGTNKAEVFACYTKNWNAQDRFEFAKTLGIELDKVFDCPGKNISVEENQKQLACTVFGHPALKYVPFVGKKYKSVCPDGGETSCISEALIGIIKNLVTNASMVKGIWDLFTQEDKLSESLHAASTASKSFFEKFKNDPFGATVDGIGNLLAGIGKFVNEAIKNNFTCSKWSNSRLNPLDGTDPICEEPMVSWECGTWAQKYQAACGVAGFLGGELIMSIVTGGAWAVASTTVKATGRVLGVGKAVSAAGKAARAARFSKLGKGMATSLGPTSKLFQFSKGMFTVVKSGGNIALKIGDKLTKLPGIYRLRQLAVGIGKGTSLMAKAAAFIGKNTVGKYLELNAKAFAFGYKGGQAGLDLAVAASKGLVGQKAAEAYETVLDAVDKASKTSTGVAGSSEVSRAWDDFARVHAREQAEVRRLAELANKPKSPPPPAAKPAARPQSNSPRVTAGRPDVPALPAPKAGKPSGPSISLTQQQRPALPAPQQRPALPAPQQRPALPAPQQRPALPAPQQRPALSAPQQQLALPAPKVSPFVQRNNQFLEQIVKGSKSDDAFKFQLKGSSKPHDFDLVDVKIDNGIVTGRLNGSDKSPLSFKLEEVDNIIHMPRTGPRSHITLRELSPENTRIVRELMDSSSNPSAIYQTISSLDDRSRTAVAAALQDSLMSSRRPITENHFLSMMKTQPGYRNGTRLTNERVWRQAFNADNIDEARDIIRGSVSGTSRQQEQIRSTADAILTQHFSSRQLPVVGSTNLPAQRAALQGEYIPRDRLPAQVKPKTGETIEGTFSVVDDLPAPRQQAALPAPKAQEALPAPRQQAALPAPKAQEALPAPNQQAALPAPKAQEALPAPKQQAAKAATAADDTTTAAGDISLTARSNPPTNPSPSFKDRTIGFLQSLLPAKYASFIAGETTEGGEEIPADQIDETPVVPIAGDPGDGDIIIDNGEGEAGVTVPPVPVAENICEGITFGIIAAEDGEDKAVLSTLLEDENGSSIALGDNTELNWSCEDDNCTDSSDDSITVSIKDSSAQQSDEEEEEYEDEENSDDIDLGYSVTATIKLTINETVCELEASYPDLLDLYDDEKGKDRTPAGGDTPPLLMHHNLEDNHLSLFQSKCQWSLCNGLVDILDYQIKLN